MTSPPSDDRAPGLPSRRRLRAEILLVLGLSLGASAVYSLVAIAERVTRDALVSRLEARGAQGLRLGARGLRREKLVLPAPKPRAAGPESRAPRPAPERGTKASSLVYEHPFM